MIMAEMMTPKAFGQRTSRSGSNFIRARENPSGGREYASTVRESNMLSRIPGDWESSVVWVS